MKRLCIWFVFVSCYHDAIGEEIASADFFPQEHVASYQSVEPNVGYIANLALEHMQSSVGPDQNNGDYHSLIMMQQPIAKHDEINLQEPSSQQAQQIYFNEAENVDMQKSMNTQVTKEQSLQSDTQLIMNELSKLPKNAYPQDITAALARMNKGEIVENAIFAGDVVSIKNSVAQIGLDQGAQKILVNLLVGKDEQGGIVAADKVGIALSKSNPAQFKQVRDAYLNLLVDMQWGLFKKSLMQQEGFASGAITVIDPAENIIRSMENYVKFVNPKFAAPGLSWSALTNDQAYSRSGKASSHWKGQIVDNRIYGINVKFDGKYTGVLPQNKSQLHFAQLTNGRLFVKWEDYGTTLNFQDTSMISHSVNYVADKIGPKKAAQRTEVTISKDVTVQFNSLLKQAGIKLTPQQIKIVQQQGISGMRDILSSNKKGSNYLASFDTFLTTQKGYDPTTLHYRKADEVILHGPNNMNTQP